jgi:hypothetical protein
MLFLSHYNKVLDKEPNSYDDISNLDEEIV